MSLHVRRSVFCCGCFSPLAHKSRSLRSFAVNLRIAGNRKLFPRSLIRISSFSSMSHRPNFQGGRRGGGRGGGGRGGGGRGGGGRGGGGRGGEQRWWDPVWRAERLRQTAPKIEAMDQNEWWGKMEEMKKGGEQEMIIRRYFSREDQQILGDMANQLSLYFHAYNKGKALVVSKVPLPDYRADLDERHGSTKKEINMSSEIERRVGNLLNSSSGSRPAEINSSSSSQNAASQSKLAELNNRVMLQTGIGTEDLNLELKQKQDNLRESDSVKTMLAFREKLPAYKLKSEFLKAVAENQVLVVSGETGCGKTTQLPQFILEEEISSLRGSSCSIICTQPRRISAISVAARISSERGEKLGDTVGYKIRLESQCSAQTRLLFCTTGVLLRQLVQDPDLSGITHLLVDEIHERGMNEDFLLIILRDILTRRPDLRIILMSATINADLFSKYFGNAPTIHIPGFTFPVKEFYLEDVLEKTRYSIQSDSDNYSGNSRRGRRQQEPTKDPLTELFEDADIDSLYKGYSRNTRQSLEAWSGSKLDLGLVETTIEHICCREDIGAILVFLSGWDEISKLLDKIKANRILGDASKFLVLPLHGSMPTINQREIFDRPPPNVRKIVLATNIAESSITIDDVVYVVDCGKAKETSYDALNKLACLLPSWISKASAHQRRGRAGRVQPGVCYRLYPKMIHDAMPEYQLPEMLRTPLQELCLNIKSLQLGSISTFLSKALQPPDPRSVENAVELLKTIGALNENEELTPLGRHLCTLPLDPNIGKMLLMGAIFQCLNPALTIAAALAHRDPFVLPLNRKEEADAAKRFFAGDSCSDHIALLKAFEGWKDAKRNRNDKSFCWENFLSPVTMQMMEDMRLQFLDFLSGIGFVNKSLGPQAYNKYSNDLEMVCAILCAGLYPNVVQCKRRGKRTAFYTKEVGKVDIHPASVNAAVHLFPLPYMVYSEKVKTNLIYIRDSTNISDYALLMFGGNLVPSKSGDGIEMLDGYLHFSASKPVLDLIRKLRGELDKLLTRKIEEPGLDVTVEGKGVVAAVIELLHNQNIR
ncbi:DExH-box ATP-dependent RNA helicase DExH1 [Andrographis paniculata]|uniref:DExH-box ATP-dependent RNA helicase DExH1 n=1 Tax=Andrographis paniculata TaxID=175694 RepID=UPI0021E9230C|nr:DExH-box ATP-dependent RNA helicase DExH1 [Andrographis paniculata]